MSQSPASRRAVRTAMVAALVPLALVLGACASSGSGSGTTPVAAQSRNGSGSGGGSGAGNGSGGPGQGGRSFPGASGLIAAASAGTLQVQSTDSQTTVTYKGSTRFSQVVAATLAVGDCVMVTGTPATGSTTDVTATSVRVEAKVDGACPTATGRGNGAGFGGGAANGGNVRAVRRQERSGDGTSRSSPAA